MNVLYQYIINQVNHDDLLLILISIQGCFMNFIQEIVSRPIAKVLLENKALEEFFKPVFSPDETDRLLFDLSKDGLLIKYIANQTPDMCSIAVNQNPLAILHVTSPTEELWLSAVSKESYLFRSARNPSNALCWAALKSDPQLLFYMQEQATEEMCLFAVKSDGLLLKFVKNKTDKICKEAIKNNTESLKFIKNPSSELCILADRINLSEYREKMNRLSTNQSFLNTRTDYGPRTSSGLFSSRHDNSNYPR
jgi:hypothetical protein